MPIFEYRCGTCGFLEDVYILKTSDEEPTQCPHCSSQFYAKQFTSDQSFEFRGAGFHAVDYKYKK